MHEGILRVSTASAQTGRPSWHLLDLHSGARTNQRARWQLCNSMELLYSLHATKSTVSNYIVCVCVCFPHRPVNRSSMETLKVCCSPNVFLYLSTGGHKEEFATCFSLDQLIKRLKKLAFLNLQQFHLNPS